MFMCQFLAEILFIIIKTTTTETQIFVFAVKLIAAKLKRNRTIQYANEQQMAFQWK